MADHYDIAIAGGGLVGASLALALAGSGARTVVVEAAEASVAGGAGDDGRGLALSLASRTLLQRLRVWDDLAAAATPIRRIHVSEQGRYGRVLLDAAHYGLEAFGFVVRAGHLAAVLRRQLILAPDIRLLCPARVRSAQLIDDGMRLTFTDPAGHSYLASRLLVVADGPRSALRHGLGFRTSHRDYGQLAIVADVRPCLAHGFTAYERFSPAGPLALLPLGVDRCVAVVCVANGTAAVPALDDDDEFLRLLQQRFGTRLGTFAEPGRRQSWELQYVDVHQPVRERTVLLGGAALTFHPNGGQGFNLALRDAMALAAGIRSSLAAGTDPGAAAALHDYLRRRRADQKRIVSFSHGIAGLFYNRDPLRGAARQVALLGLAALPCVQRELVRLGTGLRDLEPALSGRATIA